MTKAVIIYGPQGCGKSQHGAALAKHFGKTEVVEAGDLPSEFLKGGAFGDHSLVLTDDHELAFHHSAVHDAVVYEFSEAARDAGIKTRQPYQSGQEQPAEATHRGERLQGIQDGFVAFRYRPLYEREMIIGVFHADEDGSGPKEGEDMIFRVPASWTAEHINVALEIERLAYLAGEKDGRLSAQFEIRKALGIEQ